MPSLGYFPRYFVILLTLAMASESLSAGEPVLRFFGLPPGSQPVSRARIPAGWVSNHENQLDAELPSTRTPNAGPTEDRTFLLTSAEELAAPTPASMPKDEPKDEPKEGADLDKRPEPPRCFVAAPMASLTVDVSLPMGLLPQDVASQCAATTRGDSRLHGHGRATCHRWSATCQTHRPLYFEEANAERYGYTPAYCLQPLISAGHFFLTIPILPYKMVVDRPRDCVSTLGHYRPGSCGPRRENHLPWHAGAAIVETAAIAAMILMIP